MNKPKRNNRNQERGSFLILFLFVGTIFIGILSTVSASGLYLKQKTQTLTTCRSKLVNIQNNMKNNLTSLMALNFKAKSLRTSYSLTNVAYRTAIATGQLVHAASLKAILEGIKKAQRILQLKQKTILSAAYLNSVTQLSGLKTTISIDVKVKTAPFAKKLAIRKVDAHSITPSYYPAYNFIEKQKITVAWEEDPIKRIPQFIRKIFGRISVVGESCAASLKQEGSRWRSVLI